MSSVPPVAVAISRPPVALRTMAEAMQEYAENPVPNRHHLSTVNRQFRGFCFAPIVAASQGEFKHIHGNAPAVAARLTSNVKVLSGPQIISFVSYVDFYCSDRASLSVEIITRLHFRINGRNLMDPFPRSREDLEKGWLDGNRSYMASPYLHQMGLECRPNTEMDIYYSPSTHILTFSYRKISTRPRPGTVPGRKFIFVDLAQFEPTRSLLHTRLCDYRRHYYAYPYLPQEVSAEEVLIKVQNLANRLQSDITDVVYNRHGILARVGEKIYWASPLEPELKERLFVVRPERLTEQQKKDPAILRQLPPGCERVISGVSILGCLNVTWCNGNKDGVDVYLNGELAAPLSVAASHRVSHVIFNDQLSELAKLISFLAFPACDPNHLNFPSAPVYPNRTPEAGFDERVSPYSTGIQRPPADSQHIKVRRYTFNVRDPYFCERSVIYFTPANVRTKPGEYNFNAPNFLENHERFGPQCEKGIYAPKHIDLRLLFSSMQAERKKAAAAKAPPKEDDGFCTIA